MIDILENKVFGLAIVNRSGLVRGHSLDNVFKD
jgi:hypothetical protein